MHRRPSSLFSSAAAIAVLLTMTACGGGGGSSGAKLISPTPGKVVPASAANAFLWLPRSTVMEKNKHILIADSGDWDRSGAKVVEFDAEGQPDWVYTGGLDFPHSAYPMPNGNVLISDTGNDRVIEVNRGGKIVWNTDNLGGGGGYLGNGKLSNGAHLLYPNDAYPLANGNILISSRFSNAVYEITKAGKVVWSCDRFMFRQHNPRLLPNGDLIVADSDHARGLIINHACNKIVFDYGPGLPYDPTVEWPRSFQPDGPDYVIGNSIGGSVLEINREKQIVDSWTRLPSPFYLSVLKNGNILTQDSNIHGAVELLPGGVVKPVVTTTNPNTYPNAIVNPSFNTSGPPGWLQGDLLTESLPAGERADMKFDTSTSHSGGSSGMISWPTNTSHLSLFWYQTINVKPNNTYDFDGWIKTSKVEQCTDCDQGPGTPNRGDATFNISYIDPHSTLNPSTVSYAPGSDAVGTQPWEEETDSVAIPAGVTQVEIQCMLNGWGTAWFDDVTFKDVSSS